MRCPDCNKFVAFEEGNVENLEAEVDSESGSVQVTGEMTLPCAECGTELKSCSFDESFEIDKSVWPEIKGETESIEYELDGDAGFEAVEDVQRTMKKKTKKGIVEVPIKNPRYMKTLRGFSVTGAVKRTVTFKGDKEPQEDTHEFEFQSTVPASSFDELA